MANIAKMWPIIWSLIAKSALMSFAAAEMHTRSRYVLNVCRKTSPTRMKRARVGRSEPARSGARIESEADEAGLLNVGWGGRRLTR